MKLNELLFEEREREKVKEMVGNDKLRCPKWEDNQQTKHMIMTRK
jgi:hypothetical protein